MAAVGGDQEQIVVAFDDTCSAVFASLCRMVGDTDLVPTDLLVDVYASLSDGAGEARDSAAGWDIATLLGAAAAHVASVRAALVPAGAVASHASWRSARAAAIAPVIAELALVQHRPLTEVAALVRLDAADVAATADRARAFEEIDPRASSRWEVWFDDAMRAEARERLLQRLGADGTGAARRRHRIDLIAALAGLLTLVLLVGWLAATDDPTADPLEDALVTTTTSEPATTTTATPPTTATTAAPTTTSAAPTTTEPEPVRLLLDPPPDGYVLADASTIGDQSFSNGPRPVLWASADATRTTGRWFVALATDATLNPLRNADPLNGSMTTARVDLAGRPAVQVSNPDSVIDTFVRIDDEQVLQFESFGMTNGELASLLASAILQKNEPIMFGADAAPVLSGLMYRTSGRYSPFMTLPVVFAAPEYFTPYVSSTGDEVIYVLGGPQQPDDLFAATLLTPPVGGAPTTTRIGDATAVIGGTDSALSSFNFAMLHHNGQTIILQASAGIDVLTQISSLKVATQEEWDSAGDARPSVVVDDAPPTTDDVRSGPTTEPPQPVSYDLGTTIARNGTTWSVQLTVPSFTDVSGIAPQVNASIDVHQVHAAPPESSFQRVEDSTFPLALDPANPLIRIDSLDATVLALVLPAPTPAASMRVTIEGVRTIDVPIKMLDTPSPLAGSAYAFSEIGAVTVELLDAAGAIVQTLTG